MPFEYSANRMQMLGSIFMVLLGVAPIITIIFLFAWINDIRRDTRKIIAVLKKHHPEEFEEED